MTRLWQLRDQRQMDEDLLRALQSQDVEVRHFAARALSAMAPDEPDAIPLLIQAASDPSPWVRGEALFGLGQAPSGQQLDVLRRALDTTDTLSRYLALLGLGKVGSPQTLDAVTARLTEPDARVRGVAALSALQLAGDRLRGQPKAAPEALSRLRQALLRAMARETDETASWRMAYALSHLADPEAAPALIETSTQGTRYARLFALRGLSMLPPTPAIASTLQAALSDPDQALAYEAAFGLTSPARRGDHDARKGEGLHHDDAKTIEVLLHHLATANGPHVRELLLREMGRARSVADRVLPLLEQALKEEPVLHATALIGLARLQAEGAVPTLTTSLTHQDFRVRAGVATATRFLKAAQAMPLLRRLVVDKDVRVVMAAAESLPAHRDHPDASTLCALCLARNDHGLLETTAPVAAALADKTLIHPLRAAFDRATTNADAEARKLLLSAASDLDPEHEDVVRWLDDATKDKAHIVRKEARQRLNMDGEDPFDRRQDFHPLKPGTEIPWSLLQARPRLQVTTTKGPFTIELMTAFAPVHCFNILQLASQGAYDGRLFHRVVPNFVVQGGDRRGDGAGATAWHGGTLRDELSHMPFDAGMVGMPKSADRDTGGDQFFITTVPTPHLNGRYTVFGRVTDGLSVVESIVVGDRIERIVVLED